uniref:Regulator of microtubule dynamics protein 3 n=1 Tax=Tetraodon nigroviridis TaxID=99883 RepID=H3DPD9_TETNG
MNSSLGRNGLIGLAVGASAAFGFIAFVIYREVKGRKARRMVLQARPSSQRFDVTDGAALLRDPRDAQVLEAQQQAMAAVESVLHVLSPEQQLELRNQLDQVLSCVASLRAEVAELRSGLQDIAQQMIPDVNPRVRRRRHVVHRERTDSTGSSSVYFTASQSAFEDTSEGGYTTAYTESDYTDRDSEKDDGEPEPEEDSEEDEKSCATVLTLRQEDSSLLRMTEAPSNGELALLLAQSDILHTGDATLKTEGFHLLLENKAQYGDSREFLWRLARAYCDVYKCTENKQEKKMYALQGLEEAELALKKNNLNAECHKWFALLAGLTSQNESMHSKLKSSSILKGHVERSLTLRDDDPMCFYLLGRWCYEVANLDWLEKKTAAAVYQQPPTSSLSDALENFLKAEELNPGVSKTVRLCIAKCHKDLGNLSEARNWTELALKM